MADAAPPGPPMAFPPPRNPDDVGRGPLICGIGWTFTSIALLTTVLRLFVRNTKSRLLGWDDWTMVLAMIFQIAFQSLSQVAIGHGLGKHDADLRMPDQLVLVFKWNWIASAPGMVVSIIARISVTILLLRLFGLHKWFRFFLIGLAGVLTVLGTALLIMTWCSTQPIEGMWNIFLPNVKRWDPAILANMQYVTQSLYTFSDIAYVLLPIVIIWRLNLPMQRRVGLIILLGLSLFTAATSITKTVVAVNSAKINTEDGQYKSAIAVLWSSIEQCCVITLGNVPPLYSTLSTKLSFSKLGSVRSIWTGIFRSSGRTTRDGGTFASGQKSGASTGTKDRGQYIDLEGNTMHLGRVGGTTTDIKSSDAEVIDFEDSASSRHLTGASQVRRTDTFTVSYK